MCSKAVLLSIKGQQILQTIYSSEIIFFYETSSPWATYGSNVNWAEIRSSRLSKLFNSQTNIITSSPHELL